MQHKTNHGLGLLLLLLLLLLLCGHAFCFCCTAHTYLGAGWDA
jgi:hypothetical protein